MNRKQLITLLVVVLVVGGIGLAVYKDKNETRPSARMGQKLVGDFPANDVTQITIRHSDAEVNLVRGEQGWTVRERNNYPANFEQIADLVRKIQDLKVVQTQPAGPSHLQKLELLEPGKGTGSGTLLQFKGAGDKVIQSLLLGAKHKRKSQGDSPFDEGGWPNGRYVLPEKSDVVAVISDPLSQAEPKPEQWVRKDFFKVEKLRSINMTATNEADSWNASRESEAGSWQLSDLLPGEQADTNKLSGFSFALNYPSFTDVAVNKSPEETGLDKPAVITLQTFENFTYTLKIGKKTADDGYYTAVDVKADLPKEREPGKDEKPEEKERLDKEFKEKRDKAEEKLSQEQALQGWVYVVPKWTLESVMKTRAELLAGKDDNKAADGSESEGDDVPDVVFDGVGTGDKAPTNGNGANDSADLP